jgi:glycosyltransferase involved in cell wall biosynthesis
MSKPDTGMSSTEAGTELHRHSPIVQWNRQVGRILFVTDTWDPQINGVVQTLKSLFDVLEGRGIGIERISPEAFRSLPLPSYPDIRLALTTRRRIAALIRKARPDHVHIVTEGPLGTLARAVCLRQDLPFTTSYHTRFPEYVRARAPIPARWSYRWLRNFHNAGGATMVGTPSLMGELRGHGFDKLRLWGRGVDTEAFHPRFRGDLGLERPVFLYVGRVAVEKNLPAFLDLDLPGTKLIVGEGPDLDMLRKRYPQAVFVGAKRGEELARHFASSDAFVFPSRTDTFGLVILEAMASGVPVAAYPVTGPLDIFADGNGGVLSEDLRTAALAALEISSQSAREKAEQFGWDACGDDFMRIVQEAQDDFADKIGR